MHANIENNALLKTQIGKQWPKQKDSCFSQ